MKWHGENAAAGLSASSRLAALRRQLKELWSAESGSELVEFALCSSIWCIASFAVIYTSFLFYANHFVASAAKNATRYAAVRGATWNGVACGTVSSSSCTATAANVKSYVEAALPPGMSSNGLTVSTTWPGTTPSGAVCDTANGDAGPNCAVSVQVGYSFSFPMPFYPQNAVQLSSKSEMSILE